VGITRQAIQTHVFNYFDADHEDIPTNLIDRWISEGFSKIVRRIKKWKGYESTVVLIFPAGVDTTASPLATIAGLLRDDDKGILRHYSVEEIATAYPPPHTAGIPEVWSEHGGNITVLPPPLLQTTYLAWGYRAAIDPLTIAPTTDIDLPSSDAEDILLSFVMYRACLHQAEFEQAAPYKAEFEESLRTLAMSESHAPVAVPIVLNSNPFRLDPELPFGPLPFEAGGGDNGYGGY
jgi:hypothetical protein